MTSRAHAIDAAELGGEGAFEEHMTQLAATFDGDFLGRQVGEAQLLEELDRRDLADVGFEEVGGVHTIFRGSAQGL